MKRSPATLCLILLFVSAMSVSATSDSATSDNAKDDPIRTLLEEDVIKSLDSPALQNREAADAAMLDEELVIGIIGGDGTPRAYATVALDYHEIINDWAGNTPVAVTW